MSLSVPIFCWNYLGLRVCLTHHDERVKIMPDIGKVLKDEIARISKREANSLLTPYIKTIRGLKQQVADIKKQIGQPAVKPPAEPKATSADQPEDKGGWFTSKGIAGMRKRLGLTRAQMATLCGVTVSAVSLWESASTGKLKLRTKTSEALLKLRKMTPAAAKKSLAGE